MCIWNINNHAQKKSVLRCKSILFFCVLFATQQPVQAVEEYWRSRDLVELLKQAQAERVCNQDSGDSKQDADKSDHQSPSKPAQVRQKKRHRRFAGLVQLEQAAAYIQKSGTTAEEKKLACKSVEPSKPDLEAANAMVGLSNNEQTD